MKTAMAIEDAFQTLKDRMRAAKTYQEWFPHLHTLSALRDVVGSDEPIGTPAPPAESDGSCSFCGSHGERVAA